MKHTATIQKEFLKHAMTKQSAQWEDLSYDAQKEYLQKHPASKKKMTAKPGQTGASINDLKDEIKSKKQELNTPTKQTKQTNAAMNDIAKQIANVGYEAEITNLKQDLGNIYSKHPFTITNTDDDSLTLKFKENVKDLSTADQNRLRDAFAQMADPQLFDDAPKGTDMGQYKFSDDDDETDFQNNNEVTLWWDESYETLNEPESSDKPIVDADYDYKFKSDDDLGFDYNK